MRPRKASDTDLTRAATGVCLSCAALFSNLADFTALLWIPILKFLVHVEFNRLMYFIAL